MDGGFLHRLGNIMIFAPIAQAVEQGGVGRNPARAQVAHGGRGSYQMACIRDGFIQTVHLGLVLPICRLFPHSGTVVCTAWFELFAQSFIQAADRTAFLSAAETVPVALIHVHAEVWQAGCAGLLFVLVEGAPEGCPATAVDLTDMGTQ